MRPLSRKQIITLSCLARQAWEQWPQRGQYMNHVADETDNPLVSESECFERWRKDQLEKAVKVRSFKLIDNRQYLRVRAHFEDMNQQSGRAFKSLMKAEDEGHSEALYKLEQNCRERGLDYPSYPQAICRRQYKCELADANEKQLWQLVYTVRMRGQKRVHVPSA